MKYYIHYDQKIGLYQLFIPKRGNVYGFYEKEHRHTWIFIYDWDLTGDGWFNYKIELPFPHRPGILLLEKQLDDLLPVELFL